MGVGIGHYYDQDGKPQHFQTVKTGIRKGKLRPTTKADARKLGLSVSVTGVIDIMDKGAGLTNWLITEAVKKATDKNYVARNYAAEGSVIHKYIEDWIEGFYDMQTKPIDELEAIYCRHVNEVFNEYNVKKPISEATFSTGEYGGAVDCHDKEANVIIDYKTKAVKDRESKEFKNDSYCMQLVAYRNGLDMPRDAKLVNVFLCRDEPEKYCYYEYTEKEVAKAEKMFALCLELYKVKNGG